MTTENGDKDECGVCQSLAIDNLGDDRFGVRVCIDCGAKYYDGVWRDRRAWSAFMNGKEEDIDGIDD